MRVAILTDNDFDKVNGVTTTLKAVLRYTTDQVSARVYTAADFGADTGAYFAASSFGMGLPWYREMRVYWPRPHVLARQIQATGVDVIHLTTPGPIGLAGRWLGRRLGVPVVASYHTHLGDYATVLSGSARVGQAFEAYVRWFYGSSRSLLVPSRACARLLVSRRYAPGRLRVWPRGVDADRFSPARASVELRRKWRVDLRRPVVLYVGRLSKEKGLELLPAIQRLLHRAAIAHQFVFVGDGPLSSWLRQEMPDAVFAGALGHDDVAVAMASADVFLFPSTTDTFGNVVLEALASGLPAVVSDVGGPAEQVINSETGYVCAAGVPRAFAEVLIALLRSHTRRAEFGRAAREWAEGHQWQHAMEPLTAAWRDALDVPAPAVDSLPLRPNRSSSH